ncbi:MAG: DAK2 domain-containing protein [Chloroflexota bacterium]|nr:DAK2 domain-containing protein [Chloroflexota bacterium]
MTGDQLRTLLDRAFEILGESEDELRDLDAAVGDGDLGVTVRGGSSAARETMRSLPDAASPADVFRALATAISSANPSSFAALVATALLAAARSVATAQSLSRDDVAMMAQQATAAVEKRGKSAIGDKTVLDALIPSVRALEAATSDEGLAAMIVAARKGIDETTPSVSRRGRAAWLGERAQGHPDPGAVAYLRFLEALQRSIEGIK